MFRCYFFLIFIRLWKFVRMECCCNGKMRQNVSVCVYSVLLWARFCFSFQAFSTTKKRTKSVHCTEVYALYCGDSNFHWLKRVSKLWYELCFLRFALHSIALLCSALNSSARELNGSYIFLIALVLDEFWVTNSCRETWLPKWWYDRNKDKRDTYVTSASRSLSISLFLNEFEPAHPGICYWSVLFLVLKTRPHTPKITKSRCWMLDVEFHSSVLSQYYGLIYMHMHRDVCTKECTFWHACVKLISFCWCSHFLCWWCVLFQWKAHCLPYNNLKFSHFTFFLCSCNGIYLNFIIRLCSRSPILMEHIHT